MDSQVFHRIHPLTIVVEAARFLGRFAYVIVFALLGGGRSENLMEIVLTAVGGLSIVAAVLRYYFTVYSLDSQRIVIKTGVFIKQNRTIPLERIQNVEIVRGVLHQMLGISDLKIETAGGTTAEGNLSALSVAEAQRLKTVLLRSRSVESTPDAPAPPHRTVYAASNKDLFLMGATENRLLFMIAVFGGSLAFIGEFMDSKMFQRAAGTAMEGARAVFDSGIQTMAWIVLGVIAVGWLASIVTTIVKYNNFVLRYVDGQFQRRYGLLTTVESVVPLARVQSLCIEAPFLRRLLGYATIHVGLAGSMKMSSEGQTHATSILCLLIKSKNAQDYVRRVFAQLNLGEVEWKPVSRLAIRRGAFRFAMLPVIGFSVAAIVLQDPRWLLGIAGVIPLAILYGVARFRSMGYATTPGFFMTRSGILYHKIHIAPHGKLQWLEVNQTPFQRMLKLSNLGVTTAAVTGLQLGFPHVQDVEVEKAMALQDELSSRVEASGLWLPDGV